MPCSDCLLTACTLPCRVVALDLDVALVDARRVSESLRGVRQEAKQ